MKKHSPFILLTVFAFGLLCSLGTPSAWAQAENSTPVEVGPMSITQANALIASGIEVPVRFQHRYVIVHDYGATFTFGNYGEMLQIMVERVSREGRDDRYVMGNIVNPENRELVDLAYQCLAYIDGFSPGFWKGKRHDFKVDVRSEQKVGVGTAYEK